MAAIHIDTTTITYVLFWELAARLRQAQHSSSAEFPRLRGQAGPHPTPTFLETGGGNELYQGWRRQRALIALGRTRAPEGITALAEGLTDGDLNTRLAALRREGIDV